MNTDEKSVNDLADRLLLIDDARAVLCLTVLLRDVPNAKRAGKDIGELEKKAMTLLQREVARNVAARMEAEGETNREIERLTKEECGRLLQLHAELEKLLPPFH